MKDKIIWATATKEEKLQTLGYVFGWDDETSASVIGDGFNPLSERKGENSTGAAEIIERLERLRVLVTVSNRFEAGPRKWEAIATKPEVATPGDGDSVYGYGATMGEAVVKAALRIVGIEVEEEKL